MPPCPIGVDENIGVASSSSPLLSSGLGEMITTLLPPDAPVPDVDYPAALS